MSMILEVVCRLYSVVELAVVPAVIYMFRNEFKEMFKFMKTNFKELVER